jgi:hypothetical protein
MGIESYYSEHSAAQTASYVQMCRDWGLVPTGGSDFHGPRVRAGSLGVPSIPMVVWEELKAKAAEARATRQEG